MGKRTVLVNGESFEVELVAQKQHSLLFELAGRTYEVGYEQSLPQVSQAKASKNKTFKSPKPGAQGLISAPIPGLVIGILVSKGETVEKGQTLMRIEAMKMENNIFAPASGIVEEIFVESGDEVSDGQELILVKA